jgi:nucleoside phosphorylase
MIFFQTALQCEARPFISQLSLKKDRDIKKFQVYSGENCKLIVSGVGKVRAAAGTSFLLTRFEAGPEDFFVNIGVCGSKSPHVKRGETVFINQVVDRDTGRSFFPDMILKHPFKEGAVETHAQVVSLEAAGESRCEYVDMEASGAFEAASFFLSPHRIFIIKTVIDHLTGGKYGSKEVEAVMNQKASLIIDWLREAPLHLLEKKPPLSTEEESLIAAISRNLRLSETLSLALKRLFLYKKLRDSDISKALDIYLIKNAGSKQEGKKIFEEIRREIAEF